MVSIITAVIGLLVAGLIILLIRRDRLHAWHGLGWIAVAVGFALLGLAPGLIDQVAHLLGIAYPPTLALTIAVAVIVVKLLVLDIDMARLAVRNERLVQRVAMLEADLRALQETRPAAPGDTRAAPGDAG